MRARKLRTKARVIAGVVLLCCTSAFGQDANSQVVNLVDGPVGVVSIYDLPIGMGPAQNQEQISAPATGLSGLSFHTATHLALGAVQLPFNIVGTDPSLGANTTTIPTEFIPLKFIFPNA